MKPVDVLIISGASMTASPWFTWADIVYEILQPKKIINLSARGTGNYYIALSCINAILDSTSQNVLCMPMFTCIDKFDMYLGPEKTAEFAGEKHRPLDLLGQPAQARSFSFWSTGSHWPLVKQTYFDNFFDTDIACVNNMLMFHSLDKLCQDRGVDLFPVFDMDIWQYLERDINAYVTQAHPIQNRDLLRQPLSSNISAIMDDKWIDFTSLIQYAIENDLPVYNDINKLHPPSAVHWDWVRTCILPGLQQRFQCHDISPRFMQQLENFSKEWQKNY